MLMQVIHNDLICMILMFFQWFFKTLVLFKSRLRYASVFLLLFQLCRIRTHKLFRVSTNKSMIKGFLIMRYILPCMRIDIMSFEIIPINDSIIRAMCIFPPIILKHLSIKILPECSIGQIS